MAVVDNSSALRLEDDVPLVVPEVNAGAIGTGRLIANPNCTTAILVVALEPLRQAFGLKRVIVSTYQAASGAGAEGMAELERETRRVLLEGGPAGHEVFAHPLAFNVIPQIDSFQPNGYTREEMKVAWESRKIMGLPDLLDLLHRRPHPDLPGPCRGGDHRDRAAGDARGRPRRAGQGGRGEAGG